MEGRDYWVLDDVLPDPAAVRARSLQRTDWIEGWPHRQESWPGMRLLPGLLPDELALVEARVQQATGARRLWSVEPEDARSNHNCIQVVGLDEGQVRPHTDARRVCRYAGVLYLNPDVPAACGTAFYRQRLPGGGLGGNLAPPKHDTLVQALGTRYVPPDAFVEYLRIDHRPNRLLLYQASLIHSACGYWGHALAERRMAAVFFWMAQ